jgi:hypothetical protein
VRRVGWDYKQPVFRPIRRTWRVNVAHERLGRSRRLAKSFENTTSLARTVTLIWHGYRVAGTTTRVQQRIQRDFTDPGSASEVAGLVAEGSDDERVQAAIVLWGQGNLARIRDAQQLALADWRDVLMRAELADEDWRARIDAEFGPPR